MTQRKLLHFFLGYICLVQIISIQANTKAQIIPDQTLDTENSLVGDTGSQIIIQGGATRGNNLFHSFKSFSLNQKQSAVFRSNNNIANIFSRITGTQASIISGILEASGNANLFLINPNGILIGPTAKLNINGSFLATTSNQFIFNYENNRFDLLKNNVIPSNFIAPNSISLVFLNSNSTINLSNTGHKNTINPFLPINEMVVPGFKVKPGKTLGLFSSNILSNGGILSAPSGNLVIGSIKNGTIDIRKYNNGFEFDLKSRSNLGDISLRNSSSFSANSGGKINVFGRNINIFDGSTIYSKNLFNRDSGAISIYTSESLNISGRSPQTQFRSSIFSDTIGVGFAPNINIKSKNIFIADSAFIGNRIFFQAQGGEVNIEASESIKIVGSSLPISLDLSAIFSFTFSSNDSGNINIETKRISLQQGGNILSTSLDKGNAGDININASESIDIIGFSPNFFEPSTINAAAFNTGNGGSIFIQTGELRISQGGAIASATLAQGQAGKVDIKANKSITLTGLTKPNTSGTSNQSQLMPAQTTIDSNAIVSPILQPLFNLPLTPSGDSGSVTIFTPKLIVKDGAIVGAFNQGSGAAGDIAIFSDDIQVINQGSISVSTLSGQGGNIQIRAKKITLNNGNILAAAQGDSTGGNIDIDTNLLVGFGDNIISANAVNSKGGNIRINTIGFFPSPGTKITATSEAGTQENGTVTLNALKIGAEETITPTPDLEIDPQVISACNPSTGPSRFVMMGPGGLKVEPEHPVLGDSRWEISQLQLASHPQAVQGTEEKSMVEATGWEKRNEKLVLVAKHQNQVNSTASKPATCDKT